MVGLYAAVVRGLSCPVSLEKAVTSRSHRQGVHIVEPTVFDPAWMLGCSLEEARRLMRGRVITPGEVEGVALEHYAWREHLEDPHSYWMTVPQAAAVLGLAEDELLEELDSRRIAFVTHRSGVRLMRRPQIERVARRRVTSGRHERGPVDGAGRPRYARPH
jgi:hypothetical protein